MSEQSNMNHKFSGLEISSEILEKLGYELVDGEIRKPSKKYTEADIIEASEMVTARKVEEKKGRVRRMALGGIAVSLAAVGLHMSGNIATSAYWGGDTGFRESFTDFREGGLSGLLPHNVVKSAIPWGFGDE